MHICVGELVQFCLRHLFSTNASSALIHSTLEVRHQWNSIWIKENDNNHANIHVAGKQAFADIYIYLGNWCVLLTGTMCMHVHFHRYWDICQMRLKTWQLMLYLVAFCLIKDLGRCCLIALKGCVKYWQCASANSKGYSITNHEFDILEIIQFCQILCGDGYCILFLCCSVNYQGPVSM